MLTERIFDKVVLNVKSRDITNFSRMTWRSWYDMSQTKWCMLKLYISKAFCNFKRKTIAFFTLVKTLLIWFSIIKWVSIITPNSYSDDDWVILAWLNTNLGKSFVSWLKWFLEYFTQQVFTCLKLTRETLEQGVKYVQSYQ